MVDECESPQPCATFSQWEKSKAVFCHHDSIAADPWQKSPAQFCQNLVHNALDVVKEVSDAERCKSSWTIVKAMQSFLHALCLFYRSWSYKNVGKGMNYALLVKSSIHLTAAARVPSYRCIRLPLSELQLCLPIFQLTSMHTTVWLRLQKALSQLRLQMRLLSNMSKCCCLVKFVWSCVGFAVRLTVP